jgi:G:T-mismatch repair DNA endonuclease (very short patch repair protein)
VGQSCKHRAQAGLWLGKISQAVYRALRRYSLTNEYTFNMPVKWEKELLSSGSFFAQKTKKVTGFCSRDFCGI